MFKKLIDILKLKKKQLQDYEINKETIEKQSNIEINVSRKNDILKIEIDDYISIGDYVGKIEFIELTRGYKLLDLISNSVLWNSRKQKVNKGTYYVITIDNRLYNILINDEVLKIDERTKKEIDEETQKEDITEERVITFDINKNEYYYCSAKHDKTGSTYQNRYYDKNRTFGLGTLDLSTKETIDAINSVFSNLEEICETENIVDVKLLKQHLLKRI